MPFTGNVRVVGNAPQSIYTGSSDSPGVLIVNLDLTNTAYVGADVFTSDSGVQIPPLGSVSLDGTETIFAICPTAQIQLQVIPGGQQWSPSAQQIAEQIAILGINVNVSSASFVITPSGDTSGVKDTSNVTSALALYDSISFAPGSYYWTNGSVKRAPEQYLYGPGTQAMIVYGVGTGITLQAIPPNLGSYGASGHAGGTFGITFDGTNSGAGSIGYQHGDFEYESLDIEVQNYTGTGSIGYQALNGTYWTERTHGRVKVNDCTTGAQFAVSGGTSSFARTHLVISITEGSNQYSGVIIGTGANVYDADIFIEGNFSAGSSTTTASAIVMNGTVTDSRVQISVECGSGTHAPMTINFASTSDTFVRCYGSIDFIQPTNFVTSNWTGGGSFLGPVNGDSSLLGLSRLANVVNLNDGLVTGRNTSRQSLSSNGTIAWAGTNSNPFTTVPVSLSGNVTGIIMGDGLYDGQLCFVVNTSSSYTITFASQSTSVVAGGNGVEVTSDSALLLIWNANVGLWFPVSSNIV
jgi:hypothetical protein